MYTFPFGGAVMTVGLPATGCGVDAGLAVAVWNEFPDKLNASGTPPASIRTRPVTASTDNRRSDPPSSPSTSVKWAVRAGSAVRSTLATQTRYAPRSR